MKTEGSDALVAIENALPNGFHDALLVAWSCDLVGRSMTLDLAIDVSPARGEERDPVYRRGLLRVGGLELVRVEDLRVSVETTKSEGAWIDAGPVLQKARTMVAPKVAEDSFVHWFFFQETNSFLHFAGRSAEWEWKS